MSLEDAPLIWATLSTGSLYKDKEERRFCSMPVALTLLAQPFLHWHCSLLLQDFSIYRGPAETPIQPCETEELLDPWTFCLQLVIVGSVGL